MSSGTWPRRATRSGRRSTRGFLFERNGWHNILGALEKDRQPYLENDVKFEVALTNLAHCAVCLWPSTAVREIRIPSFCILSWRVVRFTPRRAAAPFGPATTPFASSRARRI